MGLFDSIFGGLFDFNHDGKTSADEELMGLGILNQISKDTGQSAEDNDWRLWCDEGEEYGLDPEDYDTEVEYLEALEEAQDDLMDY